MKKNERFQSPYRQKPDVKTNMEKKWNHLSQEAKLGVKSEMEVSKLDPPEAKKVEAKPKDMKNPGTFRKTPSFRKVNISKLESRPNLLHPEPIRELKKGRNERSVPKLPPRKGTGPLHPILKHKEATSPRASVARPAMAEKASKKFVVREPPGSSKAQVRARRNESVNAILNKERPSDSTPHCLEAVNRSTSWRGRHPSVVLDCPNETTLRDYDFQVLLGQGAYGVVHRASNKASSQMVAIKQYDKSKLA